MAEWGPLQTSRRLGYVIEVDTSGAHKEIESLDKRLSQFMSVAYATLGLMSRMGLGEDATKAIRVIQQLISTANMLRTTLTLLEMQTPYGWVMAAFSLIGTAMTIESQMESWVA